MKMERATLAAAKSDPYSVTDLLKCCLDVLVPRARDNRADLVQCQLEAAGRLENPIVRSHNRTIRLGHARGVRSVVSNLGSGRQGPKVHQCPQDDRKQIVQSGA
jgi:hypothetical protein